MNILILVIITIWSFGGGFGNFPPEKMMVSTPEQAAIEVYFREKAKFGPEPDKHTYLLYQVDLTTKTVKQIDIPVLKFEPRNP